MNLKRYLLATATMLIFVFLYEMVVHGFILSESYGGTAAVWRNFAEMQTNRSLTIYFQLALSAWSAFVFSQLYPKGGMANGLRFGLFFGVFAGILTASWYLWLPVPAKLGVSWLLTGIGQGLGSGFILGAIYRK